MDTGALKQPKQKLTMFLKKIRKSQVDDLISKHRNADMKTLLEDMNKLSIGGIAIESIFDIPECMYPEYTIRIIPKGSRYLLTCDGSSIRFAHAKKPEKSKLETVSGLPSFRMNAVYSYHTKTYYITEVLNYKTYNYSNIAPKVKDYMVKSHFPERTVIETDKLRLMFCEEFEYAPETLKTICSTQAYKIKEIHVTNSNFNFDCFILYPSTSKALKAFKFSLKHDNGVLTDKDGVFILNCGNKHTTPLQKDHVDIIIKAKHLDEFKRYIDSLVKSSQDEFTEEVDEFHKYTVSASKKTRVKRINTLAKEVNRLCRKVRDLQKINIKYL